LLQKGEAQAALEVVQQEESEVYRLLGRVTVQHALGRAAESDAAVAELSGRYEREWAYNIAYAFAFRNQADAAFEWLAKAVQYRDPELPFVAVENLFANLYDDPRWLPFLASIGASPEQLDAIEFEVTLPTRKERQR
jgi:hypothetical protein